jgi:hypothetical protein
VLLLDPCTPHPLTHTQSRRYETNIYPHLPEPGLVHFVGFEHIGFDNWYPDFLPPNPVYGTGCELRAAIVAVRDRGHFAMPYTNPTWWDMRAPTLAVLPPGLTLRDVTAWNSSFQTIFEVYNPLNPAGAAMELAHPYVRHRWEQLMAQLGAGAGTGTDAHDITDAACNESTVQLVSDFIFEDQLGARRAYADTNVVEAGRGALGYQQSMLDHAR